jgi:hypothetical protein
MMADISAHQSGGIYEINIDLAAVFGRQKGIPATTA